MGEKKKLKKAIMSYLLKKYESSDKTLYLNIESDYEDELDETLEDIIGLVLKSKLSSK